MTAGGGAARVPQTLRPAKRSFGGAWGLAAAGAVLAATPAAVVSAWLGTPEVAATAPRLGALVAGLDDAVRVVGLACLGYGLVVGVAYPWLANRYHVTEDTVSEVHGIVAKQRKTTRLAHVRRVGVTQSVLGRLLGYGDVQFYSAGSGDVDVTFKGVRHPQALVDALQDATPAP